MAKLPPKTSATLDAIDAAILAKAESGHRPHLGASMIGRPCDRALWYSFRWTARAKFPARVLRMFRRGQDEEAVFTKMLRDAGVEVVEADPSTGRQFNVSACGGHFGGSLDGAAIGIKEAPKAWHVLEYKTHGSKSFAGIQKDGIAKAKPEHHAQVQVYMHLTGMERAYYLAVNKDDDSLYAERVRHDPKEAERLLARAERIIFSGEPPDRVSDDPAWFLCKWCDYAEQCHAGALPEAPNCRNCLHATPEPEVNGHTGPGGCWSCQKWKQSEIPVDTQRVGCDEHLFIPALIPAEVTGGSEEANRVDYKLPDGREFSNGKHCKNCYTSLELAALDFTLIGNEHIEAVRESMQAHVIKSEPGWKPSEREPFSDMLP